MNDIKCEICNKTFVLLRNLSKHISIEHKNTSKEEYYLKFINPSNSGFCKTCKSKTEFRGLQIGFLKYCSLNCKHNDKEFIEKRTEKTKKTNLEKYGVENVSSTLDVKNKRKQTNLKKYGVEYFLNKDNKLARNKIKSTCLKKYGSTNPLSSNDIKEKIKKTNLDRYGFENPFSSNEIKEKIKKTNLEKFGVEYFSQTDEMKNKSKKTSQIKYGYDYYNKSPNSKTQLKNHKLKLMFDKLNNLERIDSLIPLFDLEEYKGVKNNTYKFQCTKCNNIFSDHLDNGRIPRCYTCNPLPFQSKYEFEIIEFINSLNLNTDIIQSNRSIISPYELDIFIPEYNLAIEFNGLYWHSESQGKDKNYHLNKTNLCEEKGIYLIHIFEDEWINKKEIVKSIIKSKLNYNEVIIDSNYIVSKVHKSHVKNFLNNNHILGYKSYNHSVGLFYKNELISLLTLKDNSYNTTHFKISQYCNKINMNIKNSFKLLFEYFLENYNVNFILAKDDNRYKNENIYLNNNFIKSTYRIPIPHHLDNNYNKRIYNLNEYSIDRIWDCGYSCFIYQP